jgi:2-polyprenyl-3-methyl-5-hydroxy-6-metoxy-1,4-benzoquinol methylase
MSKLPPDTSNGYESIADVFMANRTINSGAATVKHWSKCLNPHASVLDIGCGFGATYTENLINQGVDYYAIDASESLLNIFQKRFPNTQTCCETVEDSDFFKQKFDAVIAIGLLFLLDEPAQLALLHKVAESLKTGGQFLFTSPYQVCEWVDVLTGRKSISLGRQQYIDVMHQRGLCLKEELTDEGGSHYFGFVKS